MQQINYPLKIDGQGRVASTSYEQHIRQMIEQVLFTSPGERVNRPDFGCGLPERIFAPNSVELAAATQYLVQGSLEQWLGDAIDIEAVEVESQESRLTVTVAYRIKGDQQNQVEQFVRQQEV